MRRRTWLLAAVAFLAACAGDAAANTTTTEAAPATTSTVAITTTVEATTTSLDEWEAIPTWRGGTAGEYRSRLFSVPFSFTTESAWTGGGETTDYLGIAKPSFSGLYLTIHDGSIEEAVTFYQGHADLEITSTGSTTVGGATGTRVDGEALRQVILGTLPDGSQIGWLEGTIFTLHLVDVAGTTVEISVDRVPPVPPGFDEESQAILDSIVWKDLEG